MKIESLNTCHLLYCLRRLCANMPYPSIRLIKDTIRISQYTVRLVLCTFYIKIFILNEIIIDNYLLINEFFIWDDSLSIFIPSSVSFLFTLSTNLFSSFSLLFGFFSTNQWVILWFMESSLSFDLLFVYSLSIDGSNSLNDFFLFLFIIPSSFDAVNINNAFPFFGK